MLDLPFNNEMRLENDQVRNYSNVFFSVFAFFVITFFCYYNIEVSEWKADIFAPSFFNIVPRFLELFFNAVFPHHHEWIKDFGK